MPKSSSRRRRTVPSTPETEILATFGVISPLFVADPNPDRIAISVSAGILLTVAFILASLSLIGIKK